MRHYKCAVVLFLVAGFCACSQEPTDELLIAGVTKAQAHAFSQSTLGGEDAPVISHPAEGSIFPFSFRSPTFRWSGPRRHNIYRLRLFPGRQNEAIASAVVGGTQRWWKRAYTFPENVWERVREAVGPGGILRVEVAGATIHLDGEVEHSPVGSVSTLRLGTLEENPTGTIVYGIKHKPTGKDFGPVPLDFQGVSLVAVRMRDTSTSLFLSGLPGVEQKLGSMSNYNPSPPPRPPTIGRSPGQGHGFFPWLPPTVSRDMSNVKRQGGRSTHNARPGGMPGSTPCVSCHAVSHDWRYAAVGSSSGIILPDDYIKDNSFTCVIRLRDMAVVKVLYGGILPEWHPSGKPMFIYMQYYSVYSIKDRAHSYVVDIMTYTVGDPEPVPLPGASDPDCAEAFGAWSSDGKIVAYCVSECGTCLLNTLSKLDIYTLPYNNGAGGAPTPLAGASNNGLSNAQPKYSPDGRYMAFYTAEEGFFSRDTSDIQVIPALGGTPLPTEANSPLLDSFHAWSPDSKWLAFVSNRLRIDSPTLFLTRVTDEGRVTPAIEVPGASGERIHVHTLDWIKGEPQ